MSNDCYIYNFRLNLKNPRHAEIAKRLGNLNKKVFKSKSEFLIRAVEHYIACMDSGDMSVPDKGGFITEDEFDERLEQAKKDIRPELYEDMYIDDSFVINNIRLLNGKNGIFVSLPDYCTEKLREASLFIRNLYSWSRRNIVRSHFVTSPTILAESQRTDLY